MLHTHPSSLTEGTSCSPSVQPLSPGNHRGVRWSLVGPIISSETVEQAVVLEGVVIAYCTGQSGAQRTHTHTHTHLPYSSVPTMYAYTGTDMTLVHTHTSHTLHTHLPTNVTLTCTPSCKSTHTPTHVIYVAASHHTSPHLHTHTTRTTHARTHAPHTSYTYTHGRCHTPWWMTPNSSSFCITSTPSSLRSTSPRSTSQSTMSWPTTHALYVRR